MRKGVVAHLFCGTKIFLIKRAATEYVDPDTWDSVSETIEDGETYQEAMARGLLEEIGVLPKNLFFLGITRAGHGFFVGSLTNDELERVSLCYVETSGCGVYNLSDLHNMALGGSIRHHYAAYPDSFDRLSRGFGVSHLDFGLKKVTDVPLVPA